uniref:Uncharacterized mitochondrial protein AtMg00810-like n=1 Tax=Tanacetum cinerariifolium TaxID=118510 RepID=A0A6L2MVD2_TANCI|nr:uncharacterized mitochondrial protein AtMg00810-like [Tanacetum cinerariifolium]
MESLRELILERAKHKREYDSRMNERQMQLKERKIDSSKVLDADLVVTEISGAESEKHDTNTRSRNDTHAEDADIKPVNDKEPMVEEIEVLETINIELEQSVDKLLAENEKLYKENEHLKQTYKDLYDSIKKTRVQTKDLNDSLIAQVNSKTVKNADLKAQIQEKVFANVTLKNELRKLKGNSVDIKFAKPSILKCVFNANHDACLTKFLKEVNSRITIQSPKTRNNNKPVEPKFHTKKPGRQIVVGHRFSRNKSSDVHEKEKNPRSCLRWISTGRIFNTVGLSAGTLNLSAGISFNPKKERLRVWLLKKLMSKNQVPQGIHKQEQPPNSAQAAAPRAEVLADSTVSISISQDASSTSIPSSQAQEHSPIISQANAAHKNMNIYQRDVKMAFLNGELKEEAKPTEKHLQAVKRIFLYLKGTINMGLWYSKDIDMSLTTYEDADHMGCQDTRRSTSGSAQFLGDKLEQAKNEIVELYFVRTEYQLTDIFTKPLPRERFNFLIDKLGMKSMSPDTLKRLAEETDE